MLHRSQTQNHLMMVSMYVHVDKIKLIFSRYMCMAVREQIGAAAALHRSEIVH